MFSLKLPERCCTGHILLPSAFLFCIWLCLTYARIIRWDSTSPRPVFNINNAGHQAGNLGHILEMIMHFSIAKQDIDPIPVVKFQEQYWGGCNQNKPFFLPLYLITPKRSGPHGELTIYYISPNIT